MPTPMDAPGTRSTPGPGPEPDDAAARLRARYPGSRVPRFVVVLVVAVIAVLGVGWVVWTGYTHASSVVSGQILRFHVDSDTRVSYVLTVDRPDPSVAVHCRVIAQGSDHQRVASEDVPVGPATARVVDVSRTMNTVFRATSVSVDACWVDAR